jgi:hypothetical protein
MAMRGHTLGYPRVLAQGNDWEETVSQRNGDKARFNRVRKKRIARHQRTRELQKMLGLESKSKETSNTESRREIDASLRF